MDREEMHEAARTRARRGAAWAALAGWVLGAALQLQQALLWPWAGYACAIGGGMSLACLAWRRAWPVALLAAVAMGFGLTGMRAAFFQSTALDPALEGRDLRLEGVVAQMPQRNDTGLRFRFDVERAQWAEGAAGDTAAPRVPRRISLAWYAAQTGPWSAAADEPASRATAMPDVHAGQRWSLTVRLKAAHGNRNPHGFDFELWLWEQGIQATGSVRAGRRDAPAQWRADTRLHPVERARESVRDAILARVADKRLGGVVAALVTGDQAAIERADWDVFRATGVAHLMSISGLHITLFAWPAAAAIGGPWRRSTRLMLRCPAQQAALVGGVVLAAAYALFSGWGVPSQRTVWMLATVALLRLGGRRWPWPCVWLLACAVVVAADPWALMQAGFWLSFVAVGVLFATDPAAQAGQGGGLVARSARGLRRLLREQLVVTVALTPLTLVLFQQVSLVGLAANLVAIPWVTLVVTPLAMLGVLCPPLWDAAAWAVGGLGVALQWLARWPWATVSMPAPALWAAVAGVAGGVLIVMRLPGALRLLGLPLIMPVLLWPAQRPAQGEFDVLAADVGQGSAVIVRTATHSLLYDAGPRYGLESDAGHRVLVPLLRAEGVDLDALVLSHRDADHTGGAAAVLAMQPRARLLSSIEAGHPLQALRPATRCEAGQHWDWDGVRFELLHPVPGDYAPATRPNAISCVLRIGNGRAAVLLAGDIEQPQEAALVARDAGALRADLLLAPHHGSKTSSSDAFLAAVAPRAVVVQAGWRNRFGHPAAQVVARYRAQGIDIIDSPRCGALRWHSAAPGDATCERQAARRYWQHTPPPGP